MHNSKLGYFSIALLQVIIEPTFCGSRFSTERLLAIEDFTFLALSIPQNTAIVQIKIMFFSSVSQRRYECE